MSNKLGGTLGQAYRGTAADNPSNVTIENRAPTQFDINYSIGDVWVYQDLSTTPSTNSIYMLSSLQGDGSTLGERAWWKVINTSVAPTGLQTLTSADSVVITPIADNINIYGDGTMITTTGAADTLTISMPGSAAGKILVSDLAGAKYLAAGNRGELLMSQGAGADPIWSTADFPATVDEGDILAATATNVVGVIPTATATLGYVLTSTGPGRVPTWQNNPIDGIATLAGDSGTATGATVTIAGGTNLTTSAAAATVTINLDAAISGTTSHVFANTGYLGTGTTAGNTLLLQAYDVNGTAYVPFATLTANNTPTMDLSTDVTINSSYIYRAGGTDVAVTDGGTGISSVNKGDVLIATDNNVIGVVATAGATNGYVLTANGAGRLPTWQVSGGIPGDVPLGGYIGYAGAVAPTGYVFTNGAYLDKTTYASLYAIYGETYGTGLIDEFLPVVSSGFSAGEQINDIAYGNGMFVAVGGVPGTSGRVTMATNPQGTWANITLTSQWTTRMITRVDYTDFDVTVPPGIWTIAGEGGKLSVSNDSMASWVDCTTNFGSGTIRAIAHNDNGGGYNLWSIYGDGHAVATCDPYPWLGGSWAPRNTMTGLSGTIYDAINNSNNGMTITATGTDTKANIATGNGGNTWGGWSLTALNGALGATTLKDITQIGTSSTFVYSGTSSSGFYVTGSSSTLAFDVNRANYNTFNDKYLAVGPAGVVEYVIGATGKTASQMTSAMISAINGFGADDVLAVASNGNNIVIGGKNGRLEYATFSEFKLPTIASTIIRYV